MLCVFENMMQSHTLYGTVTGNFIPCKFIPCLSIPNNFIPSKFIPCKIPCHTFHSHFEEGYLVSKPLSIL
uniref:Uncharacterized protein n=1 Tax=Lepeophtheirus salmonis TaxID=72036 RepID=A0A0K2ULP5_LEPSM